MRVSFGKTNPGAVEMIQPIKALATKSDDWSLTPGTLVVEGEN